MGYWDLLDADAMREYLAGYKLVYQGGHHDVFCNGKRHITTNGGQLKLDPRNRIMSEGGCDCAMWKKKP